MTGLASLQGSQPRGEVAERRPPLAHSTASLQRAIGRLGLPAVGRRYIDTNSLAPGLAAMAPLFAVVERSPGERMVQAMQKGGLGEQQFAPPAAPGPVWKVDWRLVSSSALGPRPLRETFAKLGGEQERGTALLVGIGRSAEFGFDIGFLAHHSLGGPTALRRFSFHTSPCADHALTRDAYVDLLRLATPVQRYQAQPVLDAFCRELTYQAATSLPTLHTTKADDGSVIIEWTFHDRRLGFSFEPNPKESGWYFVWSHGSSERFEAGTLDQLEMSRLVKLALRT